MMHQVYEVTLKVKSDGCRGHGADLIFTCPSRLKTTIKSVATLRKIMIENPCMRMTEKKRLIQKA